MKNELLTTNELAKYLRCTSQTLRRRRCMGRPPRFLKVAANRVLYRRVDVEEWLTSVMRESTRLEELE